MEGELISSLEEFKKSRKKNKYLHEQLFKCDEQVKEAKAIEEPLANQMTKREKDLERQLAFTLSNVQKLEENNSLLKVSLEEMNKKMSY